MEDTQLSLYDRVFKKEWSYYTGAAVITVLAISLALFSGTWGASGPLSTWAAEFFALFGVSKDAMANVGVNIKNYKFFGNQASMTDVGMAFGALIACLLAAQWKIRNIKHYKQALAAIIGGLLMGIGAAIASGCNIGGLFTQIPQFSLSGWIYLLFVFLGAIVGGKLLPLFMPPTSNKRPNRKRLTAEERARNRKIQIIVGFALVVLMIIVSMIVAPKYPKAPAIIFIGLGLGYALQRSRFCFTAAYRDPSLTGETKLTRAVIVALAMSTVLFFGLHVSRYGIDLAKLENVPGAKITLFLPIGAFIFGIGAVLAGGCASGTFVRMGEGYVQNYIAFVFFCLGNFLGKVISTAAAGSVFTAGKAVYLPQVFGGFMPALIIQLLALLGLWILAAWWENKKKGSCN